MPGPSGSNGENSVFTAALAIIEIGGVSVGKIKSLQFTENVQRGEVQGIGSLTLAEVPPISVRCSFTADSYAIDFSKLGTVPDPFWPTSAKTAQEFANTILLNEKGVNLHLYSKIPKVTSDSGIVTDISKFKIGVVADCFLDSRVFSIQEAQVSGKNITGRYLEPMSTI